MTLYMRNVLFLIFALLLACGSVTAMDDREALDTLQEAESLFEEGNGLAQADHAAAMEKWRRAASRYELAIREARLEGKGVFYNLGNVYYRMGDIGRAILNYRREMKYASNDSNLAKNLESARRLCLDNVREAEGRRVARTLLFWHYDLPLWMRERLFLALFALFCLAASARLFLRRLWLSLSMWALLLSAMAFGGSMLLEEHAGRVAGEGVIVAEETCGRKGNSDSYEMSFQKPLHSGTEFTLLETRGDWMEIRLADGQTCWIHRQDAELL